MSKKNQKSKAANQTTPVVREEPRRPEDFGGHGISTDGDLVQFLLSTMAQTRRGDLSASACSAIANTAGKAIKIAELRLKYGTAKKLGGDTGQQQQQLLCLA
jgi:hypothetical protein